MPNKTISIPHTPKNSSVWLFSLTEANISYGELKGKRLKMTPHYMMSDNGTDEVRHGLGLLIVKQIVSAHEGTVIFGHSESNGFCCAMIFPNKKTE